MYLGFGIAIFVRIFSCYLVHMSRYFLMQVPNGAAGHYLLGLIYRYADRRKSAIHHFKQALTIDPSMWAVYEELCVLGSAEEAAVVFGEAAALSIQKQYLHHGLASQSLLTVNDDCNLVSGRNFSFEDVSPRQLKLMQGSNTRDSSGNSHVILGGVSGQPTNGSSNISFYNTPSPMPMQEPFVLVYDLICFEVVDQSKTRCREMV